MRESGIKTGKRAIKTIENAFLYLDILAFLTQASGSGLLAIQSMANTGNKIAIAGMAISCCNFLVFAGTIYMIHRAVIRETPEFYQSNLRPVFLALYLNIIGLNIRSIYRLIEFGECESLFAFLMVIDAGTKHITAQLTDFLGNYILA
jgi:hypothetical protein